MYKKYSSGFLTVSFSALLAATISLGGCSLVPEQMKDWLASSPDDEYSYAEAGWDYPANEVSKTEQQPPSPPQEQWHEQSWSNGAPVNYAPPVMEAEESKRKLSPVGPVVNSPTQKLKIAEKRIEDLEVEVSVLKRDLNALLPAVRQLMAQNKQPSATPYQNPSLIIPPQQQTAPKAPPVLHEQQHMQQNTVQPHNHNAYTGTYIVPEEAKTPVHTSNTTSTALGVRFGKHGEKTRVVIDVNSPATSSYKMDDLNHSLIIDLPNSSWDGPRQSTLNKSDIFSRYEVRQSPEGGTRLMLYLRKKAKIIYMDKLTPNKTYKYHRIFLDIVPVH